MRRWRVLAAGTVGAALLTAGAAKYLAADRLEGAILAQTHAGLLLAGLLACLVPAAEVVLGTALLLPSWRRVALPWTLGLLLGLLGWKLSLIARGLAGDCGCLGPLAASPPRVTVWIDLGLLALASIAGAGDRAGGATRTHPQTLSSTPE